MKILLSALSILLFLFAAGCQALRSTIPTDQATASQRKLIDEKIMLIQGIFNELGSSVNLDDIPIVVSDVDVQLPGTDNKIGAYCNYNQPRHIVLRSSIFARLPESKTRSGLLGVIMHEIGHCHLNRKHDSRAHLVINPSLSITTVDAVGQKHIDAVDKLPPSLMSTEDISVYNGFEKYYAAELLGLLKSSDTLSFANDPGFYLR